MLDIRLLGPLEVAVDGESVRLARQKLRALLTLLALRPIRPFGHREPKEGRR